MLYNSMHEDFYRDLNPLSNAISKILSKYKIKP